jgi:heptaprenyl diphosphate synthase
MITRDSDEPQVHDHDDFLKEQPDATNAQAGNGGGFSAPNKAENNTINSNMPNEVTPTNKVDSTTNIGGTDNINNNKDKNNKNNNNKDNKGKRTGHISSTKKIALLAMFTALSLIMFLIENLFPSLLLPGAKMGLANIFSFAALILYGPIEAFIVVVARTLLGAMFAGNFSSLLFSFTGGIVSMAISSVLMYLVYPKISIFSVSIVAAICHNITQNLVYVILYQTPVMLKYMPYLALIGILSGTIVGGVTCLLFKKVPLSVYEKALLK